MNGHSDSPAPYGGHPEGRPVAEDAVRDRKLVAAADREVEGPLTGRALDDGLCHGARDGGPSPRDAFERLDGDSLRQRWLNEVHDDADIGQRGLPRSWLRSVSDASLGTERANPFRDILSPDETNDAPPRGDGLSNGRLAQVPSCAEHQHGRSDVAHCS
jgi:hypothetical protein